MTHNVVSVSGGKDSTALLLLAIVQEGPNLQAVFADTAHEHQQTYDYVNYRSKARKPVKTLRTGMLKT